MREVNIRLQRAAAKEILTEEHAVDSLAFATDCMGFDWGRVIFSDETTILPDDESRANVYCEPGKRYIQQRQRSGRFSVSCWDWMSRDGADVLERIDGRFGAPCYLHILENVLLPSA